MERSNTCGRLCTMTAPAARIQPERITMAGACAITGKRGRALRDLAATGKLPGAVKIGGEWTFSEAKLRAWIDELEKQQATPCPPVVRRPRDIATGTATSSGRARRS